MRFCPACKEHKYRDEFLQFRSGAVSRDCLSCIDENMNRAGVKRTGPLPNVQRVIEMGPTKEFPGLDMDAIYERRRQG